MSRIPINSSDEIPIWKQLVHQEIETLGSIQKVADAIGYARSSLSLALRDKYIGSTDQLEKTVIRVLGNVLCPYLDKKITPQECRNNTNREAPTQNPADMRFWRSCQVCTVSIKPRDKDKWQT